MSNIKLFESKQIRIVWNEFDQKWYFSVQDVVQLLTDTTDVKDYIKKMKKRDAELNSNWGTICPLSILILGNGGNKQTKTYNEDSELNSYVEQLQTIDCLLKTKLRKGLIHIKEKQLLGKLEFDY